MPTPIELISFDGTFEVFKPILVRYEEEGAFMKVYPNPVTNEWVHVIVNPDLLKGEHNPTYFLLRSITGEIVHQQMISTTELGDKISLKKRFRDGVYIIELHSPSGTTSEKIIVN